MYVRKTERLPIKIWAEEGKIEDGALAQIDNVSKLPMAFRHVALMPDAHQGYGMPIGGVAALDKAISPNMVGVDIGCGVQAMKTSLTELEESDLKKILSLIRKSIPTGFKHHKASYEEDMPPWMSIIGSDAIVEREWKSATRQIGTLGGGNHFIEIQKGSDGFIWAMVHSGSRNIGYTVARHYNEIANTLNRKWHSSVSPKWELDFLPSDSDEGQRYIAEMNYCLAFAKASRDLMMRFIRNAFEDVLLAKSLYDETYPFYDIHHNYASLENHFGKNVWIHRKGATLARKGTIGIIPGSQGTASYIVKGKGNPESFMSCSHGAGRTMSRSMAKKVLVLDKVRKSLDDKGILHSVRSSDDLDEAPQAYKNIDKVMEQQSDLVESTVKLVPLAVIKAQSERTRRRSSGS